jgi:tetratricopeptide (TPR) repeat protein
MSIDIEEPKEFDFWWGDLRQQGFSPAKLMEMLFDHSNHFLLCIRHAQIILRDDIQLSKKLTLKGLLSTDKTVQIFAMTRLCWIDSQLVYLATSQETNTAMNLIDVYLEFLKQLSEINPRTNLLLEVIAGVHRNLSESYFLIGKYQEANLEIVKAILIVDALEMKNTLTEFKSFQLWVIFHLGYLDSVKEKSLSIIHDDQLQIGWRNRASDVYGMALSELADDDSAIYFLESNVKLNPGRKSFQALYFFALANCGRLPNEVSIQEFSKVLSNETFTILQCNKILGANQGKPRKNDWVSLLNLAGKLKPESDYIIQTANYFRCFAALRLGEFSKSVNLLPNADKISDGFFSLKSMSLLLGLEIAILCRENSYLSIITQFKKLTSYLESLPLASRKCIARRGKILFPYASAFLAFAPFSSIEFAEVCVDILVHVDGKASVFSKSIQPILAGCILLDDFGIQYKKKLNEIQMAQEKEVFLQLVFGDFRSHWYKPISSAFLIFQFLKCHEEAVGKDNFSDYSIWSRAARDIANGYGLVPHPRGFETEKRQKIEHLLEQMLKGNVLPSEFYALLDTDSKSR